MSLDLTCRERLHVYVLYVESQQPREVARLIVTQLDAIFGVSRLFQWSL